MATTLIDPADRRRRGRARLRGRAAPDAPRASSSGSTKVRGQLQLLLDAARMQQRHARPHPARRPARARQDDARDDRGARERAAAAACRAARRSSTPATSPRCFERSLPGEVLFIDEIHRMARSAEEMLYLAMEDFRIDIMVGKGAGRHHRVPLDLAPFTLVGATTRSGLLPNPLRDRFGFTAHLEFYDRGRARAGARRAPRGDARRSTSTARHVAEIAGRCRGTPRIANRLLRRVRDYALVHGAAAPDVDRRARGARPLRRRRARPRPPRPRRDGDHPHALRRRAGRAQHARGLRGRGGRDDRGGRRAVPRAHRAHHPNARAGGSRPRRRGGTSGCTASAPSSQRPFRSMTYNP